MGRNGMAGDNLHEDALGRERKDAMLGAERGVFERGDYRAATGPDAALD